MLGTFMYMLLMPQMLLPIPVFSSMLSSVLGMFCQPTRRVFSPIRVNRKLPASGVFVSLGTQAAALVQKVGPVPSAAVPRVQPPLKGQGETAALLRRTAGGKWNP